MEYKRRAKLAKDREIPNAISTLRIADINMEIFKASLAENDIKLIFENLEDFKKRDTPRAAFKRILMPEFMSATNQQKRFVYAALCVHEEKCYIGKDQRGKPTFSMNNSATCHENVVADSTSLRKFWKAHPEAKFYDFVLFFLNEERFCWESKQQSKRSSICKWTRSK